jgi:glycosyltransferase involved in cell wall biosynthesis
MATEITRLRPAARGTDARRPSSGATSARLPRSPRRRHRPAQTLSIVIPALNEEESIGSTIQRCLDARAHICRSGSLTGVEIIVVSDGSTDRTAAIAAEFAAREPSVSLIVFEKNRGYGAAIKEGFRRASGDLLSFLDADGTCDPVCFGEMCRALRFESISMALGSRLGAGNQMPRVRRLGNRVYAFLLGFLSGQTVTDTASGMRVLRREALPHLDALPDGLHFTPAMSARAIMSDLRIVEVPIPYAERVGESKLRVLRDGIRFLLAIGDALLLYRPGRLFGLLAGLCLAAAAFWGLYPVEFYTRYHRLEEWMIYRLLLCALLGTGAVAFTSTGVLVEHVLSLVYRRSREPFWSTVSASVLSGRHLAGFAVACVVAAVGVVSPGLIEYVRTAHLAMHWSRAILAAFLLQLALLAVMHAVMHKVIGLWQQQLRTSQSTHE